MFDYFYIFINFIYCTIILISFIKIVNKITDNYKWDKTYSFYLFSWHLIIFIIYMCLEQNDIFVNDGSAYFYYPNHQTVPIREVSLIAFLYPGNSFFSEFMNLFRILQFDFISVGMLFQSLGALALIIFANCTLKLYNNFNDSSDYSKKRSRISLIGYLIFFLPSISYWSATVSKDTLMFFGFSMFILGIYSNKKNYVKYAILVLAVIRPHLIAFIFLYYLINYVYYYFKARSFSYKKIISFFFLFPVLIIVSLNLLIYLTNAEDIVPYSFNTLDILIGITRMMEIFMGSYKDSNLAINASNNFEVFFLYIFGPLNASLNPMVYIWIVENLLICLMIISSILNINIGKNSSIKISEKSSLLFISILLILFSSLTINNYGIASRQKWTFILMLVFALNYFNFSYFKKKN
jgi:hypothetical protein